MYRGEKEVLRLVGRRGLCTTSGVVRFPRSPIRDPESPNRDSESPIRDSGSPIRD